MNISEEFLINQEVIVSLPDLKLKGKITGIAWRHIITGYIVTLEEPLQTVGCEGWTTICATADMLR